MRTVVFLSRLKVFVPFAMLLATVSFLGAKESGVMPFKEPPQPQLPKAVPAFPGAWGGGMFATGGRGGKVFEVSNLNDSGPGSLREACEAEGARTVVFRISGIIKLQSKLHITQPNITIAGQSAPGDGICVAGESTSVDATNVIIRHMRFRRGVPEGGQGSDCLGGDPQGQLIIDHCSTSWGMDENISFYRYMEPMTDGKRRKLPIRNITIQWTISSEALNARNHAFGGTWGGIDSTFHHNLFACNTGRNPSVGMGGEFDFRNNVVFNWRHRTMDGGGRSSRWNVIANYHKAGPATEAGELQHRIARAEVRGRPGQFYVAGNYAHGFPEVTADNWNGGVMIEGGGQFGVDDVRVTEPYEAWPINQETALEAFESVMKKVGATLPKRDAVDRRVVESVRTGKPAVGNGIINDPNEVGGFPEFKSAKAPVDTDHDGMPDVWEKANGLNSRDAADGPADADKDGYTNLEEWLNGTDPKKFIDYKDLKNNVDTIS
jgi:pectate lyase